MIFFMNRAMGIGNSGVEHAEFYRAKLFDRLGIDYRFVMLDVVRELREAMAKWQIKNRKMINIWEYFTFGDDYLRHGIEDLITPKDHTLIDGTNTYRIQEYITSGGLRIVNHLVKYPDKHKKSNVLLVSTGRTEIFNQRTGEKRVMFSYVDDQHRGMLMKDIHLYNQNGQHLFFANEVLMIRYFMNKLNDFFGHNSTFIIDRGEGVEMAIDYHRPVGSHIVNIVHADHLSDRDDPKNPLWNNHYEYLLTRLNRVDRVVVATKLQREDLIRDFPQYAKKFVAIPVGGVRDQKTAPVKTAVGDPIRLITASRLASEKHIDLIIRAVAALNKDGVHYTLDIYGGGGEEMKLNQLIDKLHAGDYVKMKGQTNQLDKLYPKYDAFVSASFSEGFGLTYIEALNAGLPVVTYKARFGAMELIKDNVNGFLQDFKRDDTQYNVDQMVTGLKRLKAADYQKLCGQTFSSVAAFQNHRIAGEWRKMLDEL